MINIVVPMAGLGSRFAIAGYDKPKPFIDILGKPMIERVMENIYIPNSRFILIGRKEHLEKEVIQIDYIKAKYPETVFLIVDKLTEGTACTLLFAKNYINDDNLLLIANSDQIVDVSISDFVKDCRKRKLDGSIMTFIDKEKNPKWSFAKLNENNLVSRVEEKLAISEFATVGIYLYSKGKDFVNYTIEMIINNDRVNNEFYTCPTYNYAIKDGAKIGIYNIDINQMNGIGTPEDLNIYLSKLGN